ncbi:MAG: hypothetical protein M1813_007797 [Trichoglossum hirsutum]|jgi:hypothetical protein|nr:MAG: hypothetical protein M1813_007797 [Trichoglossum hirsutum]
MTSIGPGLRAALLEAFTAAVELLPPALQERFVLIGGTSMLTLGGSRQTEDVDIAVTAETLNAFQEGAALDPRFSQDSILSWTYTSNTPEASGICVALEFLEMGGGFVPEIRAARPTGLGGYRAGLAELVLMKAQALHSRELEGDRDDLRFLLGKMEASDENFQGVVMDDEDEDILKDAVASLGGRYSVLLEALLHRA